VLKIAQKSMLLMAVILAGTALALAMEAVMDMVIMLTAMIQT